MRISKRIFDIFWVLVGMPFLIPLFIIIPILIKLDDGGPVFFVQERIGYKGKPFKIWKFRTMVVGAEQKGNLITVGRDPRITRVGYFLRKFKLDELPQLFNVLKGEMSLVGPRPEVEKYVKLYTLEQRKVLDIMPGITDPASIRYSNESEILGQFQDPEKAYVEIIMPEKIKLNLEYAEEASCWKDFLIIVKTFFRILNWFDADRETFKFDKTKVTFIDAAKK
ncbi:lipopolysaccharide/colanic/teichoic acid biosynthesis glycosyltransferase [Caldicoprobacter guelmensis]|uniref:sugar transferase n=1 Tax=Caldicoprobacter guelmensis TaxID=1170224 RepID=UPI001956C13F|nr:sugar transferase [Caldicoprobacter guelmensis]MBM7581718.1 lipopolysaccharide/colanic/teichoic acid biosynthesis glycosyltransferase [Caldicoprobacter guelmensis]